MSSSNQPTMNDEAETVREMAGACAAARKLFPDEALVQSYLIARFLGDPKTFATMKRLLEVVLRRRIGLQRPYTSDAFFEAIERADRAGKPAKIIDLASLRRS